MELAAVPHQRTGLERLQLQGTVIQQPLRFRIGRQHYLESAIEAKAVHEVSTHPPTWRVTRLQQGYGKTRGL